MCEKRKGTDMTKTVEAHCPGEDPTRRNSPEVFSCPKNGCEGEVEIWTDEKSGKCSLCAESFPREALKAH